MSSECLVDRFHFFCLPTAHLSIGLAPTHTLFTHQSKIVSPMIFCSCFLFKSSLVLIRMISSCLAKFLSAQLAIMQHRAKPSLSVVSMSTEQSFHPTKPLSHHACLTLPDVSATVRLLRHQPTVHRKQRLWFLRLFIDIQRDWFHIYSYEQRRLS